PVSSPVRRPPWRPLFPYTTLFRSAAWKRDLASSRRFGGVETSAGVAGTAAVSVLLDLAAVLRGLAVLAPVSAIVSLSLAPIALRDRKSTRLNSSHVKISYAVFCLK